MAAPTGGRRGWVGLLVAIGVVTGALAWPLRAAERYDLANGIAAVVNDSVVTILEVRQAAAPALDLVQRTFRNDQAQLDKKADQAINDAQEQLIERQLKLHEFKTAGGNLPESFIDDEIKDRIRQQFGDRVTLIKNLQAQGVKTETYRQRIREEIILNYMERKNVREALLISPAKIERFYQTNLNRFQLGNQVKLRMIALNRPAGAAADETKAVALEIRSKIVQGASFADMASSYSEGSQRKEGGSLGWVEESALSPLSKMALSLPTNQCSNVIGIAREADDSYWLYEYDDKGAPLKGRHFSARDAFLEEKSLTPDAKPGPLASPNAFFLLAVDERQVARTRPLQEVREEIEKELLVIERNRLQKRWVERLKTKSYITYF